MRTVHIDFTGADAPVDFFAGYTGEANNTELVIRLPENLCSEDVDYYRIQFKTACRGHIQSGKLYAEDGVLTLTLWYELLRNSGTLLMQMSAYDFEDNELVRLGKTPIATLKVKPSIPPGAQGDTDIYGMEAEIEELIQLHSKGDCSVMVNTFTDLPVGVKAGTLALVHSPPPKYEVPDLQTFVDGVNYPRIYLNPYPPRPAHVYTGDDEPESIVFVNIETGVTFPYGCSYMFFAGGNGGIPVVFQVITTLGSETPMFVYTWDEFDLSEELHIGTGWHKVFIDFETGDLYSITPITAEEIPVLEPAGKCQIDSFYMSYFISAQPYFREVQDSLFVFDGTEWKPFDTNDTSIKPVGLVPVTGIDFPTDTFTCNVGSTIETAKARTIPRLAVNQNIIYSIGDETLFSLSWQTNEDDEEIPYITGLKAGTTTLTATTQEGGFHKSRNIIVQGVH